ncbi:hypothetical protein Tco_0356328 [Tanacetum coccineum]
MGRLGTTAGVRLVCSSLMGPLSIVFYVVSWLDPGLANMDMAPPPRNLRHQYLRHEGLQYNDADILDFESRLTRIYKREMHRVHVFDFGGLSDLMADRLSTRMLMEHKDAQGHSVFTSRAWRRLFDIRGPLVYELILEFFSTFRFGEAVTDLDTVGVLQFQLGGVRRRMSWREFILALGLYTSKEMQTIGISSAGDFLSITPSYTAIRDPILRLCHRLIACSIAGRSQALEKVTVTDLFYLRGIDVGLVNVSYLLARLLTAEILQGLTVIALELPVIDMVELVRLQICMDINDTCAWVAMGPERHPDVATGAPRVAQDAPVVDEGVQANPAPIQAPTPPPPAASRTMPQSMAILEEDVHEIRGALTEQREVIDVMARDFSRFSTSTITSLTRMMDMIGVTYMSYSETPREYQRRRVRQRTGKASTSTSQQDQHQPDP